jgi:glucosamine 6-phosphate synthetase-like amidotransferase/phosphosugar isomerase protein
MCGILGMAFQRGHTMKDSGEVKDILHKLFVESEVRGGTATGCSFVDLHDAMIIKHHIRAKRFIETDYYINAVNKRIVMGTDSEPIIILGHTRLKTKGTQYESHNNHPIVTDKVVGVHNGVISNDDALFDLYNMPRKGRVDSEAIFRVIEHHLKNKMDMENAICAASNVLLGSYACAAVELKIPWTLWLFRNSGPISLFRYPAKGLVIFASAERFIKEAVKGLDLGTPAEMEIKADEGVGMNMLQNRQVLFKIGEGAKRNTKVKHGNQ